MNSKISVIIDKNLVKNLRFFQAELIKQSGKSVSFSDAVNLVLTTGMQYVNPKKPSLIRGSTV